MNITISRATIDDFAEVLALHNLTHKLDPWPMSHIQEIYDNDVPIVIMKDREIIIGFLIYLVCLDEVRIINLAIHPDHQKKGYATHLIRVLVSEAQNNNWRYILLDVRTDNYTAIKLYTNLGFIILCMRKNFYNHNENIGNAYLMQLEN